MTEAYDFEKLARDIVASRLGALAEQAPAAAAEISTRIMVSALKSTAARQDPRLTVTAVCRGTMSGLMFINQDLSKSSARILKELDAVSQEAHFPIDDLMTWAMQGFAEVALLSGPDVVDAMGTAIEAELMGAGEVFNALCDVMRRKASSA